jgi:tetratricopeptide (TPR) repeat protein
MDSQTSAESYFQKAIQYHQAADLKQAHDFYLKTVRADGSRSEAWNNLGVLLRDQGRILAALAYFRRAVDQSPNTAIFRMNLGDICWQVGRTEEAKSHLKFVTQAEPEFAPAWYTLANIQMTEGHFEEGHRSIDKALRIIPEHVGVRWTKAFGYLMAQDYKMGFPEWECRLDLLKLEKTGIPLWRGESLVGKTMLVYGEQGLGDVLQFVRFLKCLPHGISRIIFEAPIELRRILEISLARWDGLPPIEFRNHGATTPYHADFQASLLSLPAYVNGFPTEPYLFSPPLNVPRPPPNGNRKKIGICWAGNPTHKFDSQRSSTLTAFFKELAMPNVDLFSLQVGPPGRTDDPTLIGPDGLVTDLGKDFKSFTDTAAAIEQLDIVVTVDTGVAHLSGAMGKDTRLLLPHHGLDWRWGLKGEKTIWYPSMKLYRRSAQDHDYENVLIKVANDLR